MCPTRACGSSSSTASTMPSPARSTGTTTTSLEIVRASVVSSGVSTVVVTVARSRVASMARTRLSRCASRRKWLGRVCLSRSAHSASCAIGWSTRWTGTWRTIRQVRRTTVRRVRQVRGTRWRGSTFFGKKLTGASAFLGPVVPLVPVVPVVRDRICLGMRSMRGAVLAVLLAAARVAGDVAPRTGGHAGLAAGHGRHGRHDGRGDA